MLGLCEPDLRGFKIGRATPDGPESTSLEAFEVVDGTLMTPCQAMKSKRILSVEHAEHVLIYLVVNVHGTSIGGLKPVLL